MKIITARNGVDEIDPTTIKVGDLVVARNYRRSEMPSALLAATPPLKVASLAPRDGSGRDVIVGIEGVDNGEAAYGYEWFMPYDQTSPTSPNPLVDFSGDKRKTARQYVEHILASFTRTYFVSDDTRAILHRVVNGDRVDALGLDAALFLALRALSQRSGTPEERERWQREVGYLHHIVHATLRNAVEGLPAYVEGERSRKVKELGQTIDSRNRQIKKLQEEVDQADAELTELDNELTATRAARDVALQVLGKALEELDQHGVDVERVLGFWDAVEPGFRHEYEPSSED